MPTKDNYLPDCYLFPDTFDIVACACCKYYEECKDIYNSEHYSEHNIES